MAEEYPPSDPTCANKQYS